MYSFLLQGMFGFFVFLSGAKNLETQHLDPRDHGYGASAVDALNLKDRRRG